MKTIKQTIIGVAAFGLATVLFTGCTTTSVVTQQPDGSSTTNVVNRFDPVKTASVLHQIIPPAVKYANQTTPQYRKYIVDSQVAACALVGSTNVTPENIKAVMDSTGINGIKTPEMQAVASGVYSIYALYYGDLVSAHLPQSEVVTDMTVLLQAICDSLTEGLAQSP